MTQVQFVFETTTDPTHVSPPEAGPGIPHPGYVPGTTPSAMPETVSGPNQVIPGMPPGPPAQHTTISGHGNDALEPTVASAMLTELATAKETIANLTGELTRVRSKNLQLEDQAGTGKRKNSNTLVYLIL